MDRDFKKLKFEYSSLLEQIKPSPTKEDYERFERQIPLLEEISRIESSAVSVFDLFTKDHLFASYNFVQLFGPVVPQPITAEYFNTRIHPEDLIQLLLAGIEMLKYSLNLKSELRKFVKLINEFRIKDLNEKWIKVIEQHKMLEEDSYGNLWLSISTLDISPNQNLERPAISRVVDLQSNNSFLINENELFDKAKLTKRESQVLSLMDKGLLSKEISNQLNISVHTVNTHRQRILEKTNSSNSIEAINFGKRVGIID